MRNLITTLLGACLIAACTETELQKSIFIPDAEHPELPAYSEWGYNTFGAYYDREPFVSNDVEVPVKVFQQGGKTTFVLTGQKGTQFYNLSHVMSVSIVLPGSANNYGDLISFHDTSINLTDPDVLVLVAEGPSPDTVEILNGQFRFVRVQYLLVDGAPEEVILSGVFGFQAVRDGVPFTMSNGRFDVGVDEENFFIR